MTYSIVARDPQTGQLGIAVQSRFFAVGRAVPWIEAGVGAIASQSFANPAFGPGGLELLRAGYSAQEALDRLIAADAGAAMRQLAVLDAQGRVAVHTGASCVAAAGHIVGAQCSVQANMMTRNTVWRAMLAAYERAAGDLADRMVAALEAAEGEGGDLRGRQAAALIVVPGQAVSSADGERLVDLRVDDHPDPVGEIKRLLGYSRAVERAGAATGKIMAGDIGGALADLDACCATYPDEPDFLTRRALVLLAAGRMDEARQMVGRAHAIHPGWAEYLVRFAEAGITPLPREVVASLVAGLAE